MSTSDKSYRRLINKECTKAAAVMRKHGWVGDDVDVVLVKTMRFPFRPRTRCVWIKQICGTPFDIKHDTLPADCDNEDYPVWFASDGEIYEISLATDRIDSSDVSQLSRASMNDWRARGRTPLYVKTLQALMKITED